MNSKLRKNEKILMKQTLTENGITLIALVITIVVLLILASVSITAVFGDNGLLKLAKEAGEKTNEAVGKELSDIQNLSSEVNDIINPPTTISEAVKRQYVFRDTTTFYAEDGKPIITIPAGFKILADTEENNVEYKDKENPTVDDGIVIADTTGNEFVWVPVFEETPIYTTNNEQYVGQLYDFNESSSSKREYDINNYHEPDIINELDGEHKDILGVSDINKFKKQLQNEFNKLVASVNRYNGFYIGRYETGNLVAEKDNIPVVKKERIDIRGVDWYYQYQTIKNIALKNSDIKVQKSVTSSMIWGCQWDAVLNWFLNSKDEITRRYVIDGVEKGNYSRELNSTGSNPAYAVNNIYDMAGNVGDWTIEVIGTIRIARGGYFYPSDYNCANARYSSYNPDVSSGNEGSRATLIIKP